MKPLLATGSVVRNLLNCQIGSWPAKPIDPAKPFQWQDRRPLKPQPPSGMKVITDFNGPPFLFNETGKPYDGRDMEASRSTFDTTDCKAGFKVGDVIYVRENVWEYDLSITAKMLREGADNWPVCMYVADMTETDVEWCKEMGWRQRPSIHMLKELSRIHLEVMRVRVERACDISEEDAEAEGCKSRNINGIQTWPSLEFKTLWQSIYGPSAWEQWVWCYDFKRIK